jgi:hypothetical protein
MVVSRAAIRTQDFKLLSELSIGQNFSKDPKVSSFRHLLNAQRDLHWFNVYAVQRGHLRRMWV